MPEHLIESDVLVVGGGMAGSLPQSRLRNGELTSY